MTNCNAVFASLSQGICVCTELALSARLFTCLTAGSVTPLSFGTASVSSHNSANKTTPSLIAPRTTCSAALCEVTCTGSQLPPLTSGQDGVSHPLPVLGRKPIVPVAAGIVKPKSHCMHLALSCVFFKPVVAPSLLVSVTLDASHLASRPGGRCVVVCFADATFSLQNPQVRAAVLVSICG